MKKGLLTIVLSTLLISGSAWGGWFGYRYWKTTKQYDPNFTLEALVQQSKGESLQTAYLTELLRLSYDRPVNLFAVPLKKAESFLLASPLIKEAKVKRIPPGTLYVEYTPRKPVAYLFDISNTAMDEEGILFPISPFFTPKKLPQIYLGGLTQQWGQQIEGENALLARKLLFELSDYPITRIDVSQAFAASDGDREIVLTFEEYDSSQDKKVQRILRLDPDHVPEGLNRYKKLKGHLDLTKTIVDLRIPQLAFVN